MLPASRSFLCPSPPSDRHIMAKQECTVPHTASCISTMTSHVALNIDHLPTELISPHTALELDRRHAHSPFSHWDLHAVDVHVRNSWELTHHLGHLCSGHVLSLPPGKVRGLIQSNAEPKARYEQSLPTQMADALRENRADKILCSLSTSFRMHSFMASTKTCDLSPRFSVQD